MAALQREWARRVRRTLRAQLGGCCVKCGSRRNLEFDCIVRQGDRHHRMEWSWRMSFYRRQHELKNLQLLCRKCHGMKSSREAWGGVNLDACS
jgi:HNH endonuclease